MSVVARNVRSRFGEVDLVADDGDTLVFVEVKTRRSTAYATAEESGHAALAGAPRQDGGALPETARTGAPSLARGPGGHHTADVGPRYDQSRTWHRRGL